MIRKTKLNGIDVSLSDGNKETDDIVDCSDCPELNLEAEKERLEFVKRQVKAFGGEYHLIDKKGKLII